ncbi:MAG TPA: GNAT family N-acetyltransferase [Microlunatus sp.]
MVTADRRPSAETDDQASRARVPTLTLFCGLPGAGKSTLAKRLEADGRGVRLCTDDWQAALGVSHASGDFHERLQVHLYRHGLNLLRAGVDVILEDGLWLRAERTEKVADARACGARIRLHVFDVPYETLWSRLQERGSGADPTAYPMTEQELRWAWNLFEPPSADELATVDGYRVHQGGLTDTVGPALVVRPAEAADAVAMARVNVRSWQETYRGLMSDAVLDDPDLLTARERFWTEMLTDERYVENRAAVAERHGELIGIAMSGPPLDAAPWSRQLYVLYVRAADHGTGAGRALLEAVVDPAVSTLLWVADPNPRAQAFYRRHGFVADGTVQVVDGVRQIRMVRDQRHRYRGTDCGNENTSYGS